MRQESGGRAAGARFLRWRGREKEIFGGEAATTNNRMELVAAIRALQALKRPSTVVLHTDSMYLKQGITTWMRRWKKQWLDNVREDIR